MTIDPRLVERRKTVAEGHAHRNVGRLLRFLIALIAAGALVWLAFSPWLSVHRVRTAGIYSSEANSVLSAERVVAGTPMIMLRPGEVEAALETDPWIKEARVDLQWPNEVIVRVTERVPVIWVQAGGVWSRRALDGVALPGPEFPAQGAPRLVVGDVPQAELTNSAMVRGAAEFIDSLPANLAAGAIVRVQDGELWATVSGYEVRLGRPIDMADKALSLSALLREEIPPDATLILVAATHPAVELPETVPSDDVVTGRRGSWVKEVASVWNNSKPQVEV